MNHHAQLTAQILKNNGFKAEVIRANIVKVSLNHRNVYKYDVMMTIEREELPIDESQLKYVCGNTYIYL